MIGYTTVGTQDLEKSVSFYDPIFKEMGFDQCWCDEQVASWGNKKDDTAPRFFTCYPFDDNPAIAGNGNMTAFLVNSGKKIDRLYEIALSTGGTDEGAPGLRPQYGDSFYAAYVRDPDGNKLAFVCYNENTKS